MTRSHRIQVGQLGPVIEVGLSVGTIQAMAGIGGQPLSRPGLIDTGATGTAISNAMFRSLQPIQSGTTPFNRPDGTQVVVHSYAVRLKFEGHLAPNPWFDLDAVVADPATPGIHILVGMDVISQLVLFYEGVNGTMILTYC
jgi:predicted aspartyl protease